MSVIRVLGWLNIKPNKLDAAKEIVATMVSTTRGKDKDTLAYDWYINESANKIVVHEQYRSAEGFVTHMGNIGGHVAKLSESIEPERIEVYGEVTPEVGSLLKDFTGCVFYKTLLTL